MADVVDAIPVIDFSSYDLSRDAPDPDTVHELVDDIHKALTTIGFFYLKNHGISFHKVEKAFDLCKQFFGLDTNMKLHYRKKKGGLYGYRPLENDRLNPGRMNMDLKEAFAFTPATNGMSHPDDDVPGFGSGLGDLYNDLVSLLKRVLQVIAMGLHLKDPQYFVKRYKCVGTPKGLTSLQSFHYPALTNRVIKGDQVRCGEHTDFGGVTLLLQDPVGGLEVKTRQGQWIEATPMPDTIVVNIGDMMQRWTSDRLIACEHKVMLPSDEERRGRPRQSIAFFGVPDADAVIECLDDTDKYPPVTAGEYLAMKYSVSRIET